MGYVVVRDKAWRRRRTSNEAEVEEGYVVLDVLILPVQELAL